MSLQKQREVAAGVVNLGNTCYMNCVLQALAHAPELCLAVDSESHYTTCPIGRQNKERRRKSPSPGDDQKKRPSRKSRRSGKKSPISTTDSTSEDSTEHQFCTLCEFEALLQSVHSANDQEPVAPSDFVHGFIDYVAPRSFKLGVQEDSHEFLRLLIDAMQKSCHEENETYPFKLFRGTVESNVSCSTCRARSSTIDPIEDIGLEVTSNTSRLADVRSALSTFTHEEPLTGYKCDKCGNIGRATKQSRLASIPPILTLHLKRFRYGAEAKPTFVEQNYSRRGNREVSQLLGASGSAKIEGHAKFLEIFDLKPYLTDELAGKVKSMFCRLFAVIVHAGKNSHSGHYVAYVRNLSKNEWWKMDDSRVTRANNQEVLNAEAYMLFYRVVDHPIAQELRAKANKIEEERKLKLQNKEKTPVAAEPEAKQLGDRNDPPALPKEIVAEKFDEPQVSREERKRKREEKPEYLSGSEWAKAETNLSPKEIEYILRGEEYISENVQFKKDFFEDVINKEAQRGKTGLFQGGVCEFDVQGGFEKFKPGLLELLFQIAKRRSDSTAFLQKAMEEDKTEPPKPESKPLIVPVMEANETFL